MRIFVSYSHQDEAWKDRVCRQLRVLAKDDGLDPWDVETDDDGGNGAIQRRQLVLPEFFLGPGDAADPLRYVLDVGVATLRP